MISELDAIRAAKILLEQHGAQEAWRILQERAMDEHFSDREHDHVITQQVITALHKLTRGPKLGEAQH